MRGHRFAWVGRLAIGLVIVTLLTMALSCSFFQFAGPWLDLPGWCFASTPDEPVMIGGFPSPAQIVPEWYLLPHYGMLRSFTFNLGFLDAKSLGMIAVGASLMAPLILAFFDWSRTRPRAWLSLLVIPFVLIGLGWIGAQGYNEALSNAGLVLTVLYFFVFWIAFPLLARTSPRERRLST